MEVKIQSEDTPESTASRERSAASDHALSLSVERLPPSALAGTIDTSPGETTGTAY